MKRKECKLELDGWTGRRNIYLGHTLFTGFYTNLNVWGSLGLNFEYDGGPIIEIGGRIFVDKLRILEGSTSFRVELVLYPGQLF